ncbi:MAG: N-acetylglucosamine-6-phosphate deacetylase [Tissierellia bacterium]|nr:N-acetylglucosamine-6-phosphate deacetylase [Tissierellia bacterium]
MIINAKKVYTGEDILVNKKIIIENKSIMAIKDSNEKSDDIVIPGFIDIHNHGGYGIDYLESDLKQFELLQKKQALEGITSMIATIGLSTIEKMTKGILKVDEYIKNKNTTGTKILGIHLEGPYLSPKYMGVMDKNLVKNDIEILNYWISITKNIKIMTLAIEEDKEFKILKTLIKNNIIASAGHSNSNTQIMLKAKKIGLDQVTHLFNAMRPLHHRELGILGIGLCDDDFYAEMAGCDMLSIDPLVWKMVYRTKTSNKIILTTDALTLKGLGDGRYNYMGHKLNIIDGFCYTDYNGSCRLPGKPMTFIDSIKNVIKCTNASLEDIVKMSSVNPSKRLKLEKKGKLLPGFDADISIIDEKINIKKVIIEGKEYR